MRRGYVPVDQHSLRYQRRGGRAILLACAIAVAVFGCIAISVTLPITFLMSHDNAGTSSSTGTVPIPAIVIPTHHMHPHLHCIYSQTEEACEEAARRHGKPGLALPWVDLCPHSNHVLINTTGENTDTSKCLQPSQLPSGCVFWTTNSSTRSGFTFVETVQAGNAQCGETITLQHETVSHTLYCVPTCHIEPVVIVTTATPTTTTDITTSTPPETTSAPSSTAPVETSSTAPETTSVPSSTAPVETTAVPPETSSPTPEVSFTACRMTAQRYCVKNKTTTVGDQITETVVDCECDECAFVTGCKCGSHEGHFHPGLPPEACIGPNSNGPCKLPNMTLGCDTINGQRYLTEQFVCGDGSRNSRNGKSTPHSCPFICLTEAQVRFFVPTFDGTCAVTDCCGNWRMHPKVDPDTGLVVQCRAPPVGSGPKSIPWGDIFAIGLPQPEQCRATCGNTSSVMCTDFHTSETCGGYITGPGFTYVNLPNDSEPGCTKPLPVDTACENNVVYDIYPTGRCIRGCEVMGPAGHCMSTVTAQHPNIPKDSTYTQFTTFDSTFWDAVTHNKTFTVNITYGPLCPPNVNHCSNLPVTGTTTCQPLTCCNTCGERGLEHLSSKQVQPWLCEHIKAPCEYHWDEGPGGNWPPLSCEDSIMSSSVVDRQQLMGLDCNGACNTTLGDSCAVKGLCVQQEQTGARSRCAMPQPYPAVFIATMTPGTLTFDDQHIIWMLLNGRPRGFVCKIEASSVYIVSYPFTDSLIAGNGLVSFYRSARIVELGVYLYPVQLTELLTTMTVSLTQTTDSGCMPPAYQCPSNSISFGFDDSVAVPQLYTFALRGTVPNNISDCLLCFVSGQHAVGECATTPTPDIHINITGVSAAGCAAVAPCETHNCNFQCLREDTASAYKGSLHSCDADAPVCKGLDGNLGGEYPCLLTPKQNNWAFNNRASSCSVGLWGTVQCADANAIPSLSGAFCVCKGGYQLTGDVCTACGVDQNSNPGSACEYVFPTGKLQQLSIETAKVQYVGNAPGGGVEAVGGVASWLPASQALNVSLAYSLWSEDPDQLALMDQQSLGQAEVCNVDVQQQRICGQVLNPGLVAGIPLYISDTNVGTPKNVIGGCTIPFISISCLQPSALKTCSAGTNITTNNYRSTDIPCSETMKYVYLTDLTVIDNRPGIGCSFMVFKVEWTGSYNMPASVFAYSCFGSVWRVGDQLVAYGSEWHLNTQVTAITDENPVFKPITI